MNIHENAPVKASSEIDVNAPPETVWDVIADIDRWPEWNPAVKEASLRGELAPGTTFRWQAGPGAITSTLRQVDPPRVLAWTGKTFGIGAVHVYRLEPRNGGTHVSTAESWEGWPTRLMRGRMQRMLEEALLPGLQALKAEAERRTVGR
jgi:uncharacterized protein YndB with AHSA1/START domain